MCQTDYSLSKNNSHSTNCDYTEKKRKKLNNLFRNWCSCKHWFRTSPGRLPSLCQLNIFSKSGIRRQKQVQFSRMTQLILGEVMGFDRCSEALEHLVSCQSIVGEIKVEIIYPALKNDFNLQLVNIRNDSWPRSVPEEGSPLETSVQTWTKSFVKPLFIAWIWRTQFSLSAPRFVPKLHWDLAHEEGNVSTF